MTTFDSDMASKPTPGSGPAKTSTSTESAINPDGADGAAAAASGGGEDNSSTTTPRAARYSEVAAGNESPPETIVEAKIIRDLPEDYCYDVPSAVIIQPDVDKQAAQLQNSTPRAPMGQQRDYNCPIPSAPFRPDADEQTDQRDCFNNPTPRPPMQQQREYPTVVATPMIARTNQFQNTITSPPIRQQRVYPTVVTNQTSNSNDVAIPVSGPRGRIKWRHIRCFIIAIIVFVILGLVGMKEESEETSSYKSSPTIHGYLDVYNSTNCTAMMSDEGLESCIWHKCVGDLGDRKCGCGMYEKLNGSDETIGLCIFCCICSGGMCYAYDCTNFNPMAWKECG